MSCNHPGPCNIKMDGGKKQYPRCMEEKKYQRTLREKGQPPDGFEDEFGPVPRKVPDYKWFDEEIVYRVVHGIPSGRKPYKLEWIKILETVRYEDATIASLCGVDKPAVLRYRKAYRLERVS